MADQSEHHDESPEESRDESLDNVIMYILGTEEDITDGDFQSFFLREKAEEHLGLEDIAHVVFFRESYPATPLENVTHVVSRNPVRSFLNSLVLAANFKNCTIVPVVSCEEVIQAMGPYKYHMSLKTVRDLYHPAVVNVYHPLRGTVITCVDNLEEKDDACATAESNSDIGSDYDLVEDAFEGNTAEPANTDKCDSTSLPPPTEVPLEDSSATPEETMPQDKPSFSAMAAKRSVGNVPTSAPPARSLATIVDRVPHAIICVPMSVVLRSLDPVTAGRYILKPCPTDERVTYIWTRRLPMNSKQPLGERRLMSIQMDFLHFNVWKYSCLSNVHELEGNACRWRNLCRSFRCKHVHSHGVDSMRIVTRDNFEPWNIRESRCRNEEHDAFNRATCPRYHPDDPYMRCSICRTTFRSSERDAHLTADCPNRCA